VLNATATMVFATARQIFNILMGIVISFYMLLDKERLIGQTKKFLYAFLPAFLAVRIMGVTRKSHHIVGGFITGKIIESAIIGLICFIFMSVMRWEYPMLISVIVGITNVIPFFGPFIGAIPCFFFLAINDMGQGLWFLVFIFVLQQFDGNYLSPKILGPYVGLSAFWIIFAVLVMNGLFGLFGMFMGVPVFAVVYTLIKERTYTRLREKGMPTRTEDFDIPPPGGGASQGGYPVSVNAEDGVTNAGPVTVVRSEEAKNGETSESGRVVTTIAKTLHDIWITFRQSIIKRK